MSNFTKGQSASWRGPDFDFPVTFEDSFKGHDGKMYANVINHTGTKSIVPLDQLENSKGVNPEDISKNADPTNPRNLKQEAPEKPYYSPETPRAKPSAPLEGLGKKSFKDQLKGMGVYVLDVETTGLKQSDMMFSAGRVKIDEKGLPIDGTEVESFFDVGNGGAIKRSHFKSYDEYQEALEKNLARSHSSKSFGQAQKERGSLAGHAKARIAGELTTPANFLSEFEQDIANTQKGSIIWGHNNQFENNQFSVERLGTGDYESVHKQMEARNIVNGSGLFGQSRKMSNKSQDNNMKGLTQRATDILYNGVNESILAQNPDALRKSLGEYAAANVDIINEVQNQIEAVRLKGGKYTVGDSLHLSRALMAFGAVTGQVDPRNLILGNKIETLSHVMLDGYKETHQALDDAKIQGIITTQLTDEIDKFRADPNYKSPLLKKLNDHITANREELANATFKSSVAREVQDLGSLDDAKTLTKHYDWVRKATRNYSIIPEGAAERASYAEQYNITLDQASKEKNATAASVQEAMEKFNEKTQIVDAGVKANAAKESQSLMKKALDGKTKILAIGGGLAAANLLLGGGEKGKDKKYNTYDELYNNQYYGSGFADWQERNNSHKVLY